MPALSAAAWIVLVIMVVVNPSGTLPMRNMGSAAVVFFILSSALSFFLPFRTFAKSGKKQFFIWFGGSLLILILMTFFGGNYFHRDFYAYATQIILLYFIIMVLKLDRLDIIKNKKSVYSTLSIFVALVFVLWTVWLILMAYAIVTRQDPRWIESTGCNLVNMVIGFLMLFSAGILRDKSRRKIYIRGEKLFLDDRELSPMLSPQESLIIRLFINNNSHTLTCRELTQLILRDDEKTQKALPDCGKCIAERWTASSCQVYRNIKNRISDIKKYLELIQIGTIIPASENPREIKETGWTLRLFDDVRYEQIRR